MISLPNWLTSAFVRLRRDKSTSPTTSRRVATRRDVFAQFGFAGDKSRRVGIVHVGRRGVAGPPSYDSGAASQEFEVGVAIAAAVAPKAFGVHVDAFAVGEIEVYFDHAAFFVFAGNLGLEGADVGVFGADDAEGPRI